MDAAPDLHPAIAALTPPIDRAALMGLFATLDITHATTEHRAVFSVEDGRDLKQGLPGGHTKNLFLKSKKGELVLISALGETPITLNAVHHLLGVARLSFGSAALLEETLGVQPGSVTAFALANDAARRVRMVLDADLLAYELVNFHPLHNTATTAIARRDLLRFIRATGREPLIVDFKTMAVVPAPP